MFPGTLEYCERVVGRDNVEFHWVYQCQPIVNVFDRWNPFWWVFDPLLSPEEWVREPPDYAYYTEDNSLYNLCSYSRFGLDPNEDKLVSVVGIRTSESQRRRRGIFSAGGHYSEGKDGIINMRPIYDWKDGDVWKAINENGFDYCSAYDTMSRMGITKRHLRIAPPTMNLAGSHQLMLSAKAWPEWFDKVSQRCPGVRTVGRFGGYACAPIRQVGETWQDVYERSCIVEAPEWIRERAITARDRVVSRHSRHSAEVYPQNKPCMKCGALSSWYELTHTMYAGDPFLSFAGKSEGLDYVHPEFFRPGAGKWKGKVSI